MKKMFNRIFLAMALSVCVPVIAQASIRPVAQTPIGTEELRTLVSAEAECDGCVLTDEQVVAGDGREFAAGAILITIGVLALISLADQF